MQLALFDLDHTLIPFDSGNAFARFLIERGVLDAAFETQYLVYCREYAAGTLDMELMHRFTVGALSAYPRAVLAQWTAEFELEMAAAIPSSSIDLVRAHQQRGDLCALVTATTRFIAEPFARSLGLAHVLATEPEIDARGHYTGETVGPPCFRADKIGHVQTWLARWGASLQSLQRSWFYTDSINDLPLLEAVTDPRVVAPDARLAALARDRGWPVMSMQARRTDTNLCNQRVRTRPL